MEFRLLLPNDVDPSTVLSPESALLPPAQNIAANTAPADTLIIEGRSWTLSDPLPIEDDSIPKYVCISYKWGSERHDHALFPDRVMSARAIPSLATVIQSQNHRSAFWTDVFCVPPHEGPSRQATLENLGCIYARAAEVVVVLGRETFGVLLDMIQHKVVSEQHLNVLESDQWIASVWTYQELVNASAVRFVSEQRPNVDDIDDPSTGARVDIAQPPIECSEFLNALGHGLMQYRESQGVDAFTMVNDFPNLNVLENVLVDWMMGSYTRYSALTIFSNIYYKRNELAANYYYAILGALSDSPRQLTWPADEANETLAEKMMHICETKGDFSFIYSVADRDSSPGRHWRPRATALPPDGDAVPPILRPILVWHYWGEAQSGTLDPNGTLTLRHMTVMRPASPPSMSEAARTAIVNWSGKPDLPVITDDTALARLVHSWFSKVGFEGRPDAIVVPDGLVFTSHSTDHCEVVDVVVSNQIRFSQGAPGLVRYLDSVGEKGYSACIFIGLIDRLLEPGVSVLL